MYMIKNKLQKIGGITVSCFY